MEFLKRMEPLMLLLLVLGSLNWAAITLFSTNVITEVFGTGTLKDVVYCVLGFAALTFVPRMFSALHIEMPGHRAHPRGA